MARALREFLVLGVKTSIPLHRWLVAHPDVRSGNVDTSWLEREWSPALLAGLQDESVETAAVAAALLVDTSSSSQYVPPNKNGLASAWRLAARQAGLR
jgi:acetyl/propionyl-CoA carboxylase alpha subunit